MELNTVNILVNILAVWKYWSHIYIVAEMCRVFSNNMSFKQMYIFAGAGCYGLNSRGVGVVLDNCPIQYWYQPVLPIFVLNIMGYL